MARAGVWGAGVLALLVGGCTAQSRAPEPQPAVATAPAAPAAPIVTGSTQGQSAPPGSLAASPASVASRAGGLGGLGSGGPAGAVPPAANAPPPFIPMTPANVPGEWRARDESGATECRLTLAPPTRGGLSGATADGCTGGELPRVAGWQSRGQDIMVTDGRGAPMILFRPAGPNRYEGTGLSRERYALWRER